MSENFKLQNENLGLDSGKEANAALIFFMWLFAIAGGFLGIILSCSVIFAKEKGTNIPKYTRKNRHSGKVALILSLVIIALAIVMSF
jgi:Na+-driven multidrug efflux pump